MESYKVGNCG